ncbi:xylose isomerase [Catenovulum maritimum]|uniref:Xylose isomerase n=1 Tax=Catenovulum maritimum TaxID=1513271 RepID=A0A0J8GVG6_9ALTE|nr:xylose isomerase [Catenovulum maritimum]KMT65304.1 xylose isomerase [Catenovulum maritimum]
MSVVLGDKEYFPSVGQIQFEGRDSDNPFAFKWYDAERIVAGKPMKDWLRFAGCYWHTFCGQGHDPFGPGPQRFEWNNPKDAKGRATAKMDAAFEFFTKMNLPYYCFHDTDLIDEEDSSVTEFGQKLDFITDYAKEKQDASGVKLLWGTANLFSNPRYMNGAGTNPHFPTLARAGAQLKLAIDATIKLNGENYVFWGGREGYISLLNTNMKQELDNFAQWLHMAKDYARKNGFEGYFFIEPKPMEPTKHQYDFDTATVSGFLNKYGLADDFKVNIEVNHATLASHTFQHELQVAADNNILGSIDANRGDYQNSWDTDQFPNNINETTEAMLVFLEAGGLQGGGVNFDAKTRRESTDMEDIFLGHIGGMDTFARSLIVADEILTKSKYKELRAQRYSTWEEGKGKEFTEGKLTLEELAEIGTAVGEPEQISGKQELFENIINQYI